VHSFISCGQQNPSILREPINEATPLIRWVIWNGS